MDTTGLVQQVRYSAWATRRVLESAGALNGEELHRSLASSYSGVHGTLAHIFQADSIWFDRLEGVSTGSLSAYAPDPDFAAFSQRWLAVLDRWVSWAESLDEAGWDRIVPYRNTKGEPDSQPAWRIALHVVNHASYHRGQITTLLRQLGREPIGTDLIAYYRSLTPQT
jgi:uncharacterized damage-inducible protein DinB